MWMYVAFEDIQKKQSLATHLLLRAPSVLLPHVLLVQLIEVAVLLFLLVFLLVLLRPLTGIPLFLTSLLFLLRFVFATSRPVCAAEVGDEERSEAVAQLDVPTERAAAPSASSSGHSKLEINPPL